MIWFGLVIRNPDSSLTLHYSKVSTEWCAVIHLVLNILVASVGREVSALYSLLWYKFLCGYPQELGWAQEQQSRKYLEYTDELEELVQPEALMKGDVTDRVACLAIPN